MSDPDTPIFPWAGRLTAPGSRRMAVRVSPAALRELRRGHPWVFDDSVRTVSHNGAPGDLAVVFDSDRRFVAIGMWDPVSPIRLRIVKHREQETIDATWWGRQLDAAWVARESVRSTALPTTGWRWVNGESDGFGGLVVDRYGDTSVVKIYSEVWFPWLADVIAHLVRRSERVVLRLSRNVTRRAGHVGLLDGQILFGSEVGGPVRFQENGLEFEADVVSGQKTGHFLDQRDNRARVRELATGRRVLDVFSCTGGFSVYGAAGGATAVTSVDVSQYAMATARQNWAHNVAAGHIASDVVWTPVVDDAFDAMSGLRSNGDRFGVVVIDPPSFAPRERDRSAAFGAYRRLAQLAVPLVVSGGVLVMASCSSRVRADEFFELVEREVHESHRTVAKMETFGHALDHTATFAEGEYLKAAFVSFAD